MAILGLFLFSFCFAQAVLAQNLYNDYFGGNRISNTVDIIGDGRGRLRGSVSTYNPFSTGRLGGLDTSYSLNPRSSWTGRSGLGSTYLRNSRLGGTFGSGERGNNWSNLFQRLNRRRYLRGRGSDSSEERGRGLYNRYNRHFRRYGSDSASSEERGRRRPYNRFHRRRWGDSSEERRRGVRLHNLYNRYNRRWGRDSGERRRRGWGRNWNRSGSGSRESGEWWRRRRFSVRSPYRNLDDSDERGIYNRPYRWRNYRNIINRLRSPYPYYNNAYSYGNRLSLFNNRWNS